MQDSTKQFDAPFPTARTKGIYEFDDDSTDKSSTMYVESYEQEQKVYDTPCEEEEDCGPIYEEPPKKVETICKSIGGQKIPELQREDIRFQM